MIETGQIWRCDDGYLIRIMKVAEKWIWVRHANGRGAAWQVHPAWFDKWERTS